MTTMLFIGTDVKRVNMNKLFLGASQEAITSVQNTMKSVQLR